MNFTRILKEINISNDPDINEVLALLQDARDYQQEWLDYGVDRVYRHIEDVDGDWLERWGEKDELETRLSASSLNRYISSKSATETRLLSSLD